MKRRLRNWFGAIGTVLMSIVSVTGAFAARIRGQQTAEMQEQHPMTVAEAVAKLEQRFGLKPDELAIVIDPSVQKLYVVRNHVVIKTYSVSTSRHGLGVKFGSKKTPWGTHRIRGKYGDGQPLGTPFRHQEPAPRGEQTGMTTRILWLQGQELGVNFDPSINENNFGNGGHVDTYWRTIYIHGTANEGAIGRPHSIGCIEMKNTEVLELFNMVPAGTLVEILKKPYEG